MSLATVQMVVAILAHHLLDHKPAVFFNDSGVTVFYIILIQLATIPDIPMSDRIDGDVLLKKAVAHVLFISQHITDLGAGIFHAAVFRRHAVRI